MKRETDFQRGYRQGLAANPMPPDGLYRIVGGKVERVDADVVGALGDGRTALWLLAAAGNEDAAKRHAKVRDVLVALVKP